MTCDTEIYGDQTGRVDLDAVRRRHQDTPSAADVGMLIGEIERLRRALSDTQGCLDVSEQQRRIVENQARREN